MSGRRWIIRLPRLLRAAVFSVVVIGGLSAGLGLSTYTIGKTNDLVFGPGFLLSGQTTTVESRCSVD